MSTTRGSLGFIDKKKRCLQGPKPLTHACSRHPLTSCQRPVLTGVIRTAECSFDAADRGAWNESKIKGSPELGAFCSVIHCTQLIRFHRELHGSARLTAAQSRATLQQSLTLPLSDSMSRLGEHGTNLNTSHYKQFLLGDIHSVFSHNLHIICFTETAAHYPISKGDCLPGAFWE